MRLPIFTLLIVMLLVIFAPALTAADPMQTDATSAVQPPSSVHWFGADQLGRDVGSRTLYGGRRTLLIAMLATLVAVVPGIGIGLWLGWSEARLALPLMNAWLAFPGLLLGLVVLTMWGQGVLPLIVATGVAQIAPFVLVIRSAVLTIRGMAYLEAAQAAGAARRQILLDHILPNIQPTLLAYTGVVFGYCILNSAALSFLGLGGEPGIPDWGVMLAEGREALRAAPWIAFVPGAAITVTVMAVNRLTDTIIARF